MLSTIQLDGQAVTLVALPDVVAPRQFEFHMLDRAAVVESVFTGQQQVQKWPGADSMAATLTWPLLTQAEADEFISFLMALRGRANAFQVGDPVREHPAGYLNGSLPVVDGASASNVAGGETLVVKGLKPNEAGVFVSGDWLQLGYRLHRNLSRVTADANGRAVLNIWPSQRVKPADGLAVIVNKPKGLWRLAANDRSWSVDTGSFATSISMQVVEYR